MVAVRRVPPVLHVLWQLPAECHRFLQQSARRNAPGDLSADSLGSSIAKRMLGAALFDSVADHGISICGSDIAVQLLVTAIFIVASFSRAGSGLQNAKHCAAVG